ALAVPQGEHLALFNLDMETARFSAAGWPGGWNSMQSRLAQRLRGERMDPFDPIRGPVLLVMARFGSGANGGGEQEWLILELDVDYMRQHVLPDLLARSLGNGGRLEYDAEVVVNR